MVLSTELLARSEGKCEMCGSDNGVSTYVVPPKTGQSVTEQVAVCETCLNEIENAETLDSNHWRCLNESMWSQEAPVQVLSYRMLKRLSSQDWAVDAIGMMYMDDATMEWAQAVSGAPIVHKDSNGNILEAGDTVTLIQDLNVKGGGFTAKRGTAVRRIRLVYDNAEHIEGKIDGQNIVILTKFVKKS